MATKEPTAFGDGSVIIHELDGVQVIIEMEYNPNEMFQVDSVGPPKMSPNERSKSSGVMGPFGECTLIEAQRRRGDGRKPESTSPKVVVSSMEGGRFGGRGLAAWPGWSNCDTDNFARLWGES